VAKRAVKSKERSQSQEGEENEGGGKLTTPTSEGPTLATLPVVREAISVFRFAVCSWLRISIHCLRVLHRRKKKNRFHEKKTRKSLALCLHFAGESLDPLSTPSVQQRVNVKYVGIIV
jgi:hypothetical protein